MVALLINTRVSFQLVGTCTSWFWYALLYLSVDISEQIKTPV